MIKRVAEFAVLVLASTLVCVLVGEVGLRVYLSRHTFYDVEMSRYAKELKIDAEDPLVGHVHRPNSEAHLMGVDVRINSAGFRDDEVSRQKGDAWRIIFLGDSLTFGWGVEQDRTFAASIERQLDAQRPTEVINFAAGNYNTVQEVSLFLNKGLEYDPDQVVVFYFINDAEPVPELSPFEWLGSLRVVTFYWSRIKALIARFDPSAGFESYYRRLYRDDAPGWRDARAALLRLRDTCRMRGIALQVVLLPELHDLVEYRFAREHAMLMEFLDANGIPALDLAPRFSDRAEPTALWVAPDDAHPNALAHRLISEYSVEFIAGPGRS